MLKDTIDNLHVTTRTCPFQTKQSKKQKMKISFHHNPAVRLHHSRTLDDTSSIDELSVADTWEQTNFDRNDSPQILSPSPLNTTTDISMKSDIKKITDTMTRDIDQTLDELNYKKSYTEPLQSSLRQFISNEIAARFTEHTGFKDTTDVKETLDQINSLERDLRVKKETLNQAEIQYKKGVEKMDNRFRFITNKMEKYESLIDSRIEIMTAQAKKIINSKKEKATQ